MDEPFEYDTQGKPCALVVERDVVAFPDALTKRFPGAKPAIDMGLESYLAVCLRASDGTHLGHMAVMDAGPLTAGEDDVAAMRIFASRTAAELERRQQAAALRRSRARVIEAGDTERRRVGRDLHDGAQQRLAVVSNLLDGGAAPARPRRAAGRRAEPGERGARRGSGRDARPRARAAPGGALRARAAQRARVADGRGRDGGDRRRHGRRSYRPSSSSPPTSSCPSRSRTRASTPRARAVGVRVARDAGALLVEVADDGCGGADPGCGTGLLGLADRIDALGGSLEVESPSGVGTRVSARLPLAFGS